VLSGLLTHHFNANYILQIITKNFNSNKQSHKNSYSLTALDNSVFVYYHKKKKKL